MSLSSRFSTSTPDLGLSPPSQNAARRNFVPPPPSFHSPQPRVHPLPTQLVRTPSSADADHEAQSKTPPTSYASPPTALSPSSSRSRYPPSASQSYKLSPHLTPTKSTRRRSSSTSAASRVESRPSRTSLSRSATQTRLPISPSSTAATTRSPYLSALSPTREPGASPATPNRHQRTSSNASSAALALTRSLRARLNRADAEGNRPGYYDSDESWDDGELDPDSEYALPNWKLECAARASSSVEDFGMLMSSPLSPEKKPLIMEATLRGWTIESQPLEVEHRPALSPARRGIVRKFSNNFSPPAVRLPLKGETSGLGTFEQSPVTMGSPKATFSPSARKVKAPFASKASSTGRGSPILLSSRPSPAKANTGFKPIATAVGSSPQQASSLLPPFRTPPTRALDLPSLYTDSESEERLEDDIQATPQSPQRSLQSLNDAQSWYSTDDASELPQSVRASGKSRVQKVSFDSVHSFDGAGATPTSHQNVRLRALSPTTRRSESVRPVSADTMKQSGYQLPASDATPRPAVAGSVYISSLRTGQTKQALHGETGARTLQREKSMPLSTEREQGQRVLPPPSRPSTPPPFSDLITMPAPTVRQSKAERILGLSAGAAAAITASKATAASEAQAMPQATTALVKTGKDGDARHLAVAENEHPCVRVRSPFELLPRAPTPVAPSSFSLKKKQIGKGMSQRLTKGAPPPTNLPKSLPILNYDPNRRPHFKEPAFASQESIRGASDASCGSGSESGTTSPPELGTPDSLREAVNLGLYESTPTALPPATNKDATGALTGSRFASSKMAASLGKAILGSLPRRARRDSSQGSAFDSAGGGVGGLGLFKDESDLLLLDGTAAGSQIGVPRQEQDQHTVLLPPLPKRKAPPALPLPLPPPPPSLPPAPIEKDVGTAATGAQATQPQTLTLKQLGEFDAVSGGIETLRDPVQDLGSSTSSDSLPFMRHSMLTSSGNASDARPSSPEIDTARIAVYDSGSVDSHQSTPLQQEDKIELLCAADDVGANESAAMAAPVPAARHEALPFHASVMGTQLVRAAEVPSTRFFDLPDSEKEGGGRDDAARRTIFQLQIRDQAFWVTKEALLACTAADPTSRLGALVRSASNLAEMLFGAGNPSVFPSPDARAPEHKDAAPARPKTQTRTSPKTKSAPLHLDITAAAAAAAPPAFLGHQLLSATSPLTPSSAMATAGSLRSASHAPSPILSPSSAHSTILVFTPQAEVAEAGAGAGAARASNTSTFARALGPLVAQQAAYVARLRMQQLPFVVDDDDGHQGGGGHARADRARKWWSGGPCDVGLDEDDDDDDNDDDEDDGPGSASSGAGSRAREDEEEGEPWMTSPRSMWGPDSRPPSAERQGVQRRPSVRQAVARAEAEAEVGHSAPSNQARPPMPRITIDVPATEDASDEEDAAGATTVAAAAAAVGRTQAAERMDILITLGIDRDPAVYEAMLTKACSARTARASLMAAAAHGATTTTPSGRRSAAGAGAATATAAGGAGPGFSGDLRLSELLQPVSGGTICQRRRIRDRQSQSLCWRTGREAEEAAWLGLGLQGSP